MVYLSSAHRTRLIFLPLLIVLFTWTGCTTQMYSVKEAYNRLEQDETQILETDASGAVQYKIVGYAGVPVLSVHGIVGGYDQGLMTAKGLLPDRQRIISISRFGYLKSDLPEDPSPERQCRAFAEVLDAEDIDQVVVMAASAGGTVAFKFALLYPERTKGMILIGSAYPSPEGAAGPSGPPRFIYNDGIFRFMLNRMHGTMLKMFGVTKDEFQAANEEEREKVRRLFSIILPIKPRRDGIFNDEEVTNPDMVNNNRQYRIETIGCPVLILHAENDPMADYSKMKDAAKRLQHAKTVVYPTGGHILFGHETENRRHIADFLDRL